MIEFINKSIFHQMNSFEGFVREVLIDKMEINEISRGPETHLVIYQESQKSDVVGRWMNVFH